MKKVLFIITSLISLTSFGQIEKDSFAIKFANTITAADLKQHLTILASDEYEGRETGYKGQKMAAEYISKHFEDIGLTPVDKGQNYLQEFDLLERKFGASTLKNEHAEGELFNDFYFYGLNNINIGNAELIFGGYGIDDKKHNSYAGIDIKDKVVFLLEGEPFVNGKSVITDNSIGSEWGESNQKKTEYAYKKGAKAVVIILSISEDGFKTRAKYFSHRYQKPGLYQLEEEFPKTVFYTHSNFAASLLNISSKKFKKINSKLNKKPALISKVKSSKITLTQVVNDKNLPTENVLGLINGTDKASEIIILTAHYDHIGIHGKKVFNGADDDGSGTVAVMELAQAFSEAKKAGHGPRRSILFMAVTGEEKGLLGSEYYSNNPIFSMENTITNLNIDMIGRLDENHPENENYVYLIGTNMLSQELHNVSEETNKTYKNIELDYRFNSLDDPNQFYYRSDHYNFAKHGVPVIFYFNGVHEDYHKATDTVDKILFDKIENITQLVFYTAWELANRDNRPKVDKTDKTH